MIELTQNNNDRAKVFLSVRAIAQVTEAGAASQWHGTRSYVKTFDGKTIEVCESASEISALIRNEPQTRAQEDTP